MMKDDEILALLTDRDERAIAEVQRKYRAYCFAIAKSILGNAEDAEECLNSTWFGLWNSVPPNAPKDLRSYLGAVCRKTALKEIEKRRAQKRGGGRVDAALEELEGVLPGEGDRVDELALRDALERFLRGLTKKARIAFIQKYWYFQTAEEIAKNLRISEESVRSSLFRSRTKLREFLRKEGFDQ